MTLLHPVPDHDASSPPEHLEHLEEELVCTGVRDETHDVRTFLLERPSGDTLRFRTGAGIVADSDPAHELDETRAKARGMLQAIGA